MPLGSYAKNATTNKWGASFLRVEESLGWEGEHYFLLYGDGQNVSVVDVFTFSHPPPSDVRGKRKQCPNYLLPEQAARLVVNPSWKSVHHKC